jgi:hypothetical protein
VPDFIDMTDFNDGLPDFEPGDSRFYGLWSVDFFSSR